MYCAQGGGEVSHTEQEELDTAMDRKQQLKTGTGLQQKLEQIWMESIPWNQFLDSLKV
jgi:hypothetical protein